MLFCYCSNQTHSKTRVRARTFLLFLLVLTSTEYNVWINFPTVARGRSSVSSVTSPVPGEDNVPFSPPTSPTPSAPMPRATSVTSPMPRATSVTSPVAKPASVAAVRATSLQVSRMDVIDAFSSSWTCLLDKNILGKTVLMIFNCATLRTCPTLLQRARICSDA